MNKLGLAHVLGTLVVSTLLGALPACYGDVSSPQGDVAEAVSQSTSSALVGKWQFVYDTAARTRMDKEIEQNTPEPAERALAKAAAEKEAAESQIEFTEDGEFFSWVEGELVLQAPYAVRNATKSALRIAMTVGGQEKATTVALHGDDEIVIDDPKKGPLTFRRAN